MPNLKKARKARVIVTGAAKPAKPATVEAAKPATVEATTGARGDERAAAAIAVAAFYAGSSLPFKSASDRFQPLNENNAKQPTVRQAAALAALLCYGAGNIKPDGTFTRGGFRVPARLLKADAPADAMLSAQPESGVLGNMLNRSISYVSGPKAGAAQREAIYRINPVAAQADLALLPASDMRTQALKALAAIKA